MNHPKDGVGQVAVALKEASLLRIGVELRTSNACATHDVGQDPLAMWRIKNLLVVVVQPQGGE
jgi:hypothetical protein